MRAEKIENPSGIQGSFHGSGILHRYAQKIRSKYARVLNQEFLILQSVAILLVVIGHGKEGAIRLFSDWFPIYSFHGPLILFISGYFYHESYEGNIAGYIRKKCKTWLIPYFSWRVMYGILMTVLVSSGILHYGETFNLTAYFLDPWMKDDSFKLMLPAWLIPTMFLIQLCFIGIRRLFSSLHIKQEGFVFSLLFLVGLGGVVLANRGFQTGPLLTVARVAFLLPVYHFGYLYKKYLEKRDKASNLLYFGVLFVVQFILFKCFHNLKLNVYSGQFSDFILLPYLTTVTGILFWLRVSKLLSKAIGTSKFVRYLGQNTWTVMMHHAFIFFIINFGLFLLKGPLNLTGFNVGSFQKNLWYTYSPGEPRFALFYVVAGVAVPLLIKYGWEKLILWLDNMQKNRVQNAKL